jgi:hypothetical protein
MILKTYTSLLDLAYTDKYHNELFEDILHIKL